MPDAVLTAKGKFLGEEISVRCSKSSLVAWPTLEIIGGRESTLAHERFNHGMANPPVIGGTYYPTPGTMLAALSVLQTGFFDESFTLVSIEGEIEQIPSEEGRIY